MYLSKTPQFIQSFYPALIWNISNPENEIFLSFDDGPNPISTPWILAQLKQFDVQASFFCLGREIQKSPHLFDEIRQAGHFVGNHGFDHLSGWTTINKNYFADIYRAEQLIQNRVFRPPYGRITPSQIKYLKKDFRIVMWDNMPGDFDLGLNSDECLKRAIRNTTKGSIVVFHDNIKSMPNLRFVLPRFLEHFTTRGYAFKRLALSLNSSKRR